MLTINNNNNKTISINKNNKHIKNNKQQTKYKISLHISNTQ